MRRFSAILALPLLAALAACGGGTPETPATTPPPAETPAETPPAAETPATQSPAAEADLGPIFGSWGFDAPACTAPIVIAANSFQGAENSCEISGFTDNGDGSYTAAMSCSSQGQTANERVAMTPIFGPQGEGVRLDYLDRDGDPVNLFSCRAQGN